MSGEVPDLDPQRVLRGSLSVLPAPANNVANCNSVPFTQDPLATDGVRQFAIWISSPRRTPLVAWRHLPNGPWSPPVDLAANGAGPFETATRLDPHNSYSLGIDGRGGLHVAGNHHNEPLRYARAVGSDLTRWQEAAMIGSDEESVTYPAFASLADGGLLFIYRNGRAGHGDVFLNHLGAADGDWERIAMLVAGRDSGESPYLNHVAVAPDGAVHVSGCFRGRGGAAANRDVWHAISRDSGRSWRSATGDPLELPLTHTSAPVAVATTPRGSGLVNQMGMDVDASGNPHISFFYYDAAGATQVALASHDGARWSNRDIAALTHRMETDTPIIDATVARPVIACTSDGNVWAAFRTTFDGRDGRLSCIRCTPGLPLREVPIYDGDLGAWEPTLDSRALRQRNEIHLLLTPAPPYALAATDLADDDPWAQRSIGVWSVDATELASAAEAIG